MTSASVHKKIERNNDNGINWTRLSPLDEKISLQFKTIDMNKGNSPTPEGPQMTTGRGGGVLASASAAMVMVEDVLC
jgi:hypothetical protein